MRAKFLVEPESRTVFSYFKGALDYAVAVDHMDRLSGDLTFRPDFAQLIDFRDVTEVVLTSDEIRVLANRTIFSPLSLRAFLVGSDLQFGLARMFGIHRDLNGEPNISVFREIRDAAGWIRCDEPVATKYIARLRDGQSNS